MAANRAAVKNGPNGVAPHGRTRKRKRFQHGNYTGYYITRYGLTPGSAPDADAGARDPRLKLMKRSWFEGKKCLDVGCNEGDLTLALVRTFRPRQMVGIDIDGYLVQRARNALTVEVDAVTEAARRRAEEGAAGGDGSSSGGGIIASTGKGSAMTRPLMPRSLRGKPPVVSGENPDARENKQTQGAGKVVTKSFGCTGGGGAGVQEVVTKQVAIKSGCEGGESAGVPKVSASASALAAEDEASPGPGRRKKNGARRAANATPRLATAAVSQSASGDGVVLDPAFTQEREITVAAEPEPGPGARRGAKPPFGSHASDEYDRAEGPADATIDVRCLSGCAVSFRREDFVIEPHDDRGYDVVCLFSVIKWMHLNGGDEAVRNVFRKAHALLRPGGRLVLEPQPWKSYKKSARQHGSEDMRVNAGKIKLRPSEFPALLMEEVGFQSWEEIGVPNEGVGGFANRSVHVFVK